MKQVDWLVFNGRRVKNETYKHLQDGVLEALKGMLRDTGNGEAQGVKLYGCEVTTPAVATPADANTADVSEGWVYLNGEIYYVPAETDVTKTGSEDFVFKTVGTTVLPSLLYYDGSTQNIHLERRAALDSEDTATSANYMPYNADTWRERIHGKRTTWSIIAGNMDTDGSGVWTPSVGSAEYQHDISNRRLAIALSIETTLATADTAYLRLKLPLDQNGTQLQADGLIAAMGTHGTEVIKVEKDADAEWIRISKLDGTDFTTAAGIDLISINCIFAAGAA